MILILGAILGFISVAFGAYAEHGLKMNITPEHFDFIMTAIRYNQLYAIIISGIGLVILNDGKLANSITLKLSGFLFIIGTLLFSFSIYFSIIFDIPKLLRLAPIGGTTLMIGWIVLGIVSLLTLRKK
ncbi:DUF423 domain-containing protein [Francisella frigiditurris]|uniref:DUF423 domain-containing protein n=1 Tax=Francisella frigiditurris TaxID=1542390 RepID=A0A1J0KUL5_9GAMM|nr:DUF423 domain-containing protein [Francisella frigiditurris]APC97496.1 hypothetical protein KX01_82 [Francisella frigiditurris]